MALVVNDRVKETSTTTGTGTFSLAGAATGFETFVAGIATGNTTYYAIFNQGTTEWEVGLGTVTDATPDTLSRTTIYSSSNSDSAVDFAAGTKDVFCTLPASKTVFGKQEGTNFTDSLLVGHSTTGTLSAAEDNVGVGIDALDAITSGDNNTAVGSSAGSAQTAGGGCTYIGSQAGMLSLGSNNTAVGYRAYDAENNVSSYWNTAVGKDSLSSAGAGGLAAQGNTAIGLNSGGGITSGDFNTCLGFTAGLNLTTGSGNILIGDADAAAVDSARTLKIVSNDGSTTTNHIIGDSSGNLTFAGTANAAGGQLTTTGKAFVMGF
jgi:hypothetical protein